MEISAITSLGGNGISPISSIEGGSISSLSNLSGISGMDFTNAITPIFDNTVTVEEPDGGAAFADILTSAVENVRVTDAEKNQMEYLLATGQLDNPAELTIATTKAQTAIELLTQLRTRSLDSYNEIIRMSI